MVDGVASEYAQFQAQQSGIVEIADIDDPAHFGRELTRRFDTLRTDTLHFEDSGCLATGGEDDTADARSDHRVIADFECQDHFAAATALSSAQGQFPAVARAYKLFAWRAPSEPRAEPARQQER